MKLIFDRDAGRLSTTSWGGPALVISGVTGAEGECSWEELVAGKKCALPRGTYRLDWEASPRTEGYRISDDRGRSGSLFIHSSAWGPSSKGCLIVPKDQWATLVYKVGMTRGLTLEVI